MSDIALKLNKKGRGGFVIEKNGEQLAKMVISVQNAILTVYHTEVSESLQNQGLAASLFSEMVSYARKNKLKVIPSCSYVLAQFKRHPSDYEDIWNK